MVFACWSMPPSRPSSRPGPDVVALQIKPAETCRWDCLALGEVMLRFDPEWGRIRTTRHFRVSEGGGRVQRRPCA
jgi:hypothetical protein